MAKLVLSLNQVNIAEYSLDKVRLTVGRKHTNDIQIDNLAVSGEHAVIVLEDNNFVIEDMNSTNGTVVNNKPIKRHVLQDADVISLGKYQLTYLNKNPQSQLGVVEQEDDDNKIIINLLKRQSTSDVADVSLGQAATSDHVATDLPSDIASTGQNPAETNLASLTPKPRNDLLALLGKMQILNGSGTGRELLLTKALTTLGKPGLQVAVITKRVNGYYLTHVEGSSFPVVNGRSIGAQAQLLVNRDVVELAGVKMQFYTVSA